MMYQNLIVPVDHGNQNCKGEHMVFTSGLVESDCKPRSFRIISKEGEQYILPTRESTMECISRMWLHFPRIMLQL